MARAPRREAGAILGARRATRVGVALILVGIVAAAIGQRELFSLRAEDSDRSIRRFVLGAVDVEVKPDAPWARVPAWLPGPGDLWAGATAHAITVRVVAPASRALLLDILTSRTLPDELKDRPAPAAGSRTELRVSVNATPVATFTIPSPGSALPRGPHASRRLHATIPVAALDGQASATLTLVNDGGPGVGIERIRLAEAWPSLSVTSLRRAGRPPIVSAAFLLVGLGLLVSNRLARPGGGVKTRVWRRALGPALGILVLSVAVAAPLATDWLPHWAWLLLIVAVLPLGRRATPRATARRSPARVLARGLGNASLALVALVVSLVAGEIALRIVFRGEPWVRSTLRLPNPVSPRPNSLGFDEREFPLERPPGVYRIAVLGDSLSVSAPRAQRFGSVVAERLNARAPAGVTFEALNFARTGIDTEEETEILQRVVWDTHPDFVLLEWYVNDLENGDYSERPEIVYPISPDTALARWFQRLTDRTLLRRMLNEEYESALQQLGFVETYPAYMHRFFGEPASPRWETAARALRAFIQECRAHHTPLAIALFPHLSAGLPAGTYEFAELHDQVLDLCRQEGVPCVDLRSTFAARRDYGSLWVHRFDAHPNGLAHRLAGERLVEVLGPYWLAAGKATGPATGAGVSRDAEPGSGASRARRS